MSVTFDERGELALTKKGREAIKARTLKKIAEPKDKIKELQTEIERLEQLIAGKNKSFQEMIMSRNQEFTDLENRIADLQRTYDRERSINNTYHGLLDTISGIVDIRNYPNLTTDIYKRAVELVDGA